MGRPERGTDLHRGPAAGGLDAHRADPRLALPRGRDDGAVGHSPARAESAGARERRSTAALPGRARRAGAGGLQALRRAISLRHAALSLRQAPLHRQDAEQLPAHRPDASHPAQREDHRCTPRRNGLLLQQLQAALRVGAAVHLLPRGHRPLLPHLRRAHGALGPGAAGQSAASAARGPGRGLRASGAPDPRLLRARLRAGLPRVPQDLAPRAHGELRAGAPAHQHRGSGAMAALRALARAARAGTRGACGGPSMTEPPAPQRRRERGRGARSTGPSLAPIPRLANRWPPLEILTGEQVERIVLAAFRVLEEAGLEIRSTAAREVYRRAGALVDEGSQMVRLGRDIVEAHIRLAPATFVLHARNAERHLHVGGDVINFGPVNGAPHISDLEGGRRYGDIAAFRDILTVTHALGVLHWQGGVVVEPVDLPVPIRHLEMYRAHIECSDIVWGARGVGGVNARDALAMSAIEHQCSIEDLTTRPTLMSVTNVNS